MCGPLGLYIIMLQGYISIQRYSQSHVAGLFERNELSTVNLVVRFVGVRNLVRRGTATENRGFSFAVNVILIQYANCNHCIYCFKAFVPIWLGSTYYQRVLFDCNKI